MSDSINSISSFSHLLIRTACVSCSPFLFTVFVTNGALFCKRSASALKYVSTLKYGRLGCTVAGAVSWVHETLSAKAPSMHVTTWTFNRLPVSIKPMIFLSSPPEWAHSLTSGWWALCLLACHRLSSERRYYPVCKAPNSSYERYSLSRLH